MLLSINIRDAMLALIEGMLLTNRDEKEALVIVLKIKVHKMGEHTKGESKIVYFLFHHQGLYSPICSSIADTSPFQPFEDDPKPIQWDIQAFGKIDQVWIGNAIEGHVFRICNAMIEEISGRDSPWENHVIEITFALPPRMTALQSFDYDVKHGSLTVTLV